MGNDNEGLDVFETLRKLVEGQEEINKKFEALAQKLPAYGEPPKYGAPAPKYPPGLYPLPKLKALIEKLAKELEVPIEGTLKDFLDALSGEGVKKSETVGGILPIPNTPNIAGQAMNLAEKLRRR